MNTELLTTAGVDINHGLELLGDMETYNETLQDFLTESATRLPNLINFYKQGDMENYGILAHAMKSDSKYLGFTRLAEMSYDHEMAGKGNDKAFADAHINELIQEANRIIGVVRQYLGM